MHWIKPDTAMSRCLLDGALIRIQYEFRRATLLRHSLTFLPSPRLEEFQNNPDIYVEDRVFAEVVQRDIVPVSIRFDYDVAAASDLVHPSCHLTLGQYKNCCIPATAPLTPFRLLDFVLRNFYHTVYQEFASHIPRYSHRFPGSITDREAAVVHIRAPSGSG